jgi:hypothetical protein
LVRYGMLPALMSDGGTLAFPTPDEPGHGKAPWPHVSGPVVVTDNSPTTAGTDHGCTASKGCSTSCVNAQDVTDSQLPNGPQDGGLAMMTGTASLFGQYFNEHTPVSPSSHSR